MEKFHHFQFLYLADILFSLIIQIRAYFILSSCSTNVVKLRIYEPLSFAMSNQQNQDYIQDIMPKISLSIALRKCSYSV